MSRVPLNTTVDEDLLKEWKRVAQEEGRDLNWYIEQLIGGFLQARNDQFRNTPGTSKPWPMLSKFLR